MYLEEPLSEIWFARSWSRTVDNLDLDGMGLLLALKRYRRVCPVELPGKLWRLAHSAAAMDLSTIDLIRVLNRWSS